MDVFDAMFERRSVREYTSDEVPEEDLRRILEAGRASASWANTQCWEIVVVRDADKRKALQGCVSERNPAYAACGAAPVLIAACARKNVSGFKKGEQATELGDWMLFDVGLFLSNLTHAAHALGYGTVHVGMLDHAAAARLLELPDDVQVVELLPLGRPARASKSGPPRRELDEIVHRDRFGE
jgi:nitroreductase